MATYKKLSTVIHEERFKLMRSMRTLFMLSCFSLQLSDFQLLGPHEAELMIENDV